MKVDVAFMDRRGPAAMPGFVQTAQDVGADGIWTIEMDHDPFLPLALAAERTSGLTLATGIAVAFARNPMTVAVAAHDLQVLSRGRFVLGLGSQIKAHVERRYGMPWSKPAARMREFVLALKAIWSTWNEGTPLAVRGEFYRHTLMTPTFSPAASEWGPPPVMVAAVGPLMTRVAGEVCDGLVVHGFTTERYLREVTLPELRSAAAGAGRSSRDVAVVLPGMVVTGSDDESYHRVEQAVRSQIAFYASTPAYRAVLDQHGRGDVADELHRLSVRGRWDDMPALIDDDLLGLVATIGTPDEVGTALRTRFADAVDRFVVTAPVPIDAEALARVVRTAADQAPS